MRESLPAKDRRPNTWAMPPKQLRNVTWCVYDGKAILLSAGVILSITNKLRLRTCLVIISTSCNFIINFPAKTYETNCTWTLIISCGKATRRRADVDLTTSSKRLTPRRADGDCGRLGGALPGWLLPLATTDRFWVCVSGATVTDALSSSLLVDFGHQLDMSLVTLSVSDDDCSGFVFIRTQISNTDWQLSLTIRNQLFVIQLALNF